MAGENTSMVDRMVADNARRTGEAVEQATVSVPEMEMGWGEFEEVRPTRFG